MLDRYLVSPKSLVSVLLSPCSRSRLPITTAHAAVRNTTAANDRCGHGSSCGVEGAREDQRLTQWRTPQTAVISRARGCRHVRCTEQRHLARELQRLHQPSPTRGSSYLCQ